MKLLSTQEVADRLDVAVSTVTYWCREGHLQAQRLGRDWAVTEEALENFVKPARGWKKGTPRKQSAERTGNGLGGNG